MVNNLPANAGDSSSGPGLGKSPGEGNGHPLQYSYLGNPIDRGALPGYSPWGHKESDMIYRQTTTTGGPVAKTPSFQYREAEFDPWSGN